MAEIRVFNPSSYTPRSYFAGRGEERRTKTMAKHHHRTSRRHRHNPFGISSGVVKDAVYNSAGALGSLWLAAQINMTGWAGIAVTAGAAIAASFVGKMVGGEPAGEEALKGGLTAAIISAVHQAGFAKNLGLGLYAPSWFGVPTASNQYLRAYPGNAQGRQGAGTVFATNSSGALVPVALPPAGVSGMGFHRFRSRYAGNY
jgi:hypothetical protein